VDPKDEESHECKYVNLNILARMGQAQAVPSFT